MLSTDSVNTSTVVVDPTNASNKVASMTASNSGSGTTAFGTIYLGLGTNAIANNTTSTLFFRFYTTASFPNFNVGLTDVAAPTNGNFAINQSQFRVGGGAYLTDPGDQLHTINGSFQLLDSYQQGVWHNVWVVVDNSTNTQSYYASTGSDDAVLLGTPSYSFRTATNNSIQTLQLISDAIYASGEDGGPVLIDDIYISSGVNTTLIPEPSTYAMIFGLAMLGLVVLGRVRGSRKA